MLAKLFACYRKRNSPSPKLTEQRAEVEEERGVVPVGQPAQRAQHVQDVQRDLPRHVRRVGDQPGAVQEAAALPVPAEGAQILGQVHFEGQPVEGQRVRDVEPAPGR